MMHFLRRATDEVRAGTTFPSNRQYLELMRSGNSIPKCKFVTVFTYTSVSNGKINKYNVRAHLRIHHIVLRIEEKILSAQRQQCAKTDTQHRVKCYEIRYTLASCVACSVFAVDDRFSQRLMQFKCGYDKQNVLYSNTVLCCAVLPCVWPPSEYVCVFSFRQNPEWCA